MSHNKELKIIISYHKEGIHLLCSRLNVFIICYIPEDEDDGYFGQEQVPLTDEIREILEEYPDGQIFKVRKWTYVRTYIIIHAKG